MPRYDVGLRRIVTLSTAIVVTAATEDEAKALAAQRALDGELTWQIQDNNVWRLCPGLALLLDTLQGRGIDHNCTIENEINFFIVYHLL